LPQEIRACLFDLDGVLVQTAKIHAAAWKQLFDGFLRERAEREGGEFRPFEVPRDYLAYVDGRLREDGVRSFLASRGIVLPEDESDETAAAATVRGLATRKNAIVLELVERQGSTSTRARFGSWRPDAASAADPTASAPSAETASSNPRRLSAAQRPRSSTASTTDALRRPNSSSVRRACL
jgi:beta-phosphoglucomutase-like phosphatase (HAD superfamily)